MALVALFVALFGGAAYASHEDGFYEIPGYDMWDKTHLNVIVVPPAHGPLFGSEGFIESHDTHELTMFNTYLKAVEKSIAAWDDAIERFGSGQLQAGIDTSVYVAGRDTIPPEVLAAPDIIVTTTDDNPVALGIAFRPDPCVVNNSELYGIANYADIYNINGQEYGHCLGIDHVGDQGGVDPTAEQQHPEHDIMNGFYTHDLGTDSTHLHCISNLDVLALEFVFAHTNGVIPILNRTIATFSQPVADYRTMCDALGSDPAPRPWYPDSDPSAPGTQPVAPTSRITSPVEGEEMSRHSFDLITGVTDQTADSTAIALVRQRKGKCYWWEGEKRFVERDCADPLWHPASNQPNWAVSMDWLLPAGRYELSSRAAASSANYEEATFERGRNLVGFRLTK
jgi:hypothetical protein